MNLSSELHLKNPSDIANKIKRQDLHLKQKKLKALIKQKLRLRRQKEEEKNPEAKEKRLAENKPQTQDTLREQDETVIDVMDEDVAAEEAQDEFAGYFMEGKEPKVLITTSKKPHKVNRTDRGYWFMIYQYVYRRLTIWPMSLYQSFARLSLLSGPTIMISSISWNLAATGVTRILSSSTRITRLQTLLL
jgi:hypothetical protein